MERVHTVRLRRLASSEKAWRVLAVGTGKFLWLPKAVVIEPADPFADTNEEEVTIPYWLAQDEGLA